MFVSRNLWICIYVWYWSLPNCTCWWGFYVESVSILNGCVRRREVFFICKSSQCLFGSYTQITSWPGNSQSQGKLNCRSPGIHKAYAVPDQFIGSGSGTVILSLSVLRIQKIITVNSITALLPQCFSLQHKHFLRISVAAYPTQPIILYLFTF